MRQGQLIDITNDRHLVNTSDCFSGDCFVLNHLLLMPLINLEIINKSMLGNATRARVEIAYLILTEVGEVSWIGERDKQQVIGKMTLKNQDPMTTDWFAHNKENEGYELKVKYRRLLIYIPTISKFGREWWTPWDTPNIKKNIEKQRFDNFIDLNYLPHTVYSKLNIDASARQKLMLTLGTEEQINLIRGNWIQTA